MNSIKKTRYVLCSAVIAVAVVLSTFLIIINMNRLSDMQHILGAVIILAVFAVVSLFLYFCFADLYNEEGHLETSRILIMTTMIFILAQMSFAFATYANQKMLMTFRASNDAHQIYVLCQDYCKVNKGPAGLDNYVRTILPRYPEFDSISFVDRGETGAGSIIQFSTDPRLTGTGLEYDHGLLHFYPVSDRMLAIRESLSYSRRLTTGILMELITVMAASVFLTIEMMIFVMKLLDSHLNPPVLINGQKPLAALGYVRQLAFLFYFASFLPSSFISVMAKNMGGSFLGITGNVLAGIPQSAETLLTCGAIFLTSMLIEKCGWKVPFLAGLLLVSGGNVLGAVSTSILPFILSRAIVGLGYGFCWMTFRNFSLFGRNEEEKVAGFSLLNAGLYAGINCGSVLGSVLAEKLGCNAVLVIAGGFTLLCSLSILSMENRIYVKPVVKASARGHVSLRILLVMILFVILMVAPTCIAGSFIGYYLPLYFSDTGHSIADAGRARLLYGVLVVYAGPMLSQYVAKHPNYFLWNIVYNVIVGLSFVLFGILGRFWPAYLAVILLSLGDSFGFAVQNNYFLRLDAVKRLGESMSMSLISFLKKMTEMLGPIVFGLLISGAGTLPVLILGLCFLVFTLLYYLRIRTI